MNFGPMAYGCMRYLKTWEPAEVDDAARRNAFACLDVAAEAGFTCFDHADIYCRGECERVFGDWLSSHAGVRDRLVIATKCGVRFADDPAGSPHRYDLSPEHIRASVDGSLGRLRCDVIDLYQLHRPDLLIDVRAVADTFVALREVGKVRAFGVSNFAPSLVDALRIACEEVGVTLVAHQVELHAADAWRWDDGVLDQCQRLRLTPLAWSPLAGGTLSDRPLHSRDEDADHPAEAARLALKRAGEAHGLDVAGAALAFLRTHPAGVVPIVGSADPARVAASWAAADKRLTREQWYNVLLAARGRALP